jgi:hypothetical protein
MRAEFPWAHSPPLAAYQRHVLPFRYSALGRIFLEACLLGCSILLFCLLGASGTQGAQAAQSCALQEPVQAGTRYVGIDEAPGDDQQVIQRQLQQAAQFDNDQRLRGAKGGVQRVCPMRTVFDILAPLPFDDRGLADAVSRISPRGVRPASHKQRAYLRPRLWRGSCQTVQGVTHGLDASS